MNKYYLIFALLSDRIIYPEGSLAYRLKALKKRFYHVHMVFKDGLVIDHKPEGFTIGFDDYTGDNPFFIPGVKLRDDMFYLAVENYGDIQAIKAQCHLYYDLEAQRDEDVLALAKGQTVRALQTLERATCSTILAKLLGEKDFYTYDIDKLYHVYAEKGIPGKDSDFDFLEV